METGAFALDVFEGLAVLHAASKGEGGAYFRIHATGKQALVLAGLHSHLALEQPRFNVGDSLKLEHGQAQFFEDEGFGVGDGEPLVIETLMEPVKGELVLGGEHAVGVLAGIAGRYCFAFGGLGAAVGSVLAGRVDSLLGRHKWEASFLCLVWGWLCAVKSLVSGSD